MYTQKNKRGYGTQCGSRVLPIEKVLAATCEGWAYLLANLQEKIKSMTQTVVLLSCTDEATLVQVKTLQQHLLAAEGRLNFYAAARQTLELQLQQSSCPGKKSIHLSSRKLFVDINRSIRRVHQLQKLMSTFSCVKNASLVDKPLIEEVP